MTHPLESIVGTATEPAEIWRAVGALPSGAVGYWPIVAGHARVFDCKLIDRIVAEFEGAVTLAANPHLTGRYLQRLALWAMRQSEHERPHAQRRCGYAVLQVLASSNRLARFPFLLRGLIRRYRAPRDGIDTWDPRPRLALSIVFACPQLPTDILLNLDAHLVACGGSQSLRLRIARHPSANAVVWRTMLRSRPSAQLASEIAQIPAARQDHEVRRMMDLPEHD